MSAMVRGLDTATAHSNQPDLDSAQGCNPIQLHAEFASNFAHDSVYAHESAYALAYSFEYTLSVGCNSRLQ